MTGWWGRPAVAQVASWDNNTEGAAAEGADDEGRYVAVKVGWFRLKPAEPLS